MKRHLIRWGSLLLALMLLLTASAALAYTQLSELSDKKIGVLTGSAFDAAVKSVFPDAQLLYYEDITTQILALQSGQIDAFVADEPVAHVMSARTSGITYIEELIQNDEYGIFFAKDNEAMVDAANQVLAELNADGRLAAIQEKWMSGPYEEKTLPDFNLTGENGTLRMATFSGTEPFSYIGPGDELIGYDIELAMYIAESLGMDLTIDDMAVSSLVPAVLSGQYDMAAACIVITEERKAQVAFSTPTYQGGLALVVREDNELEALRGKRIGCLSSNMLQVILKEHDLTATPVLYNDYSSQVVALESSQIDAIIVDEPIGSDMVAQNKNLKKVETLVQSDTYAYALAKENEELAQKIDAEIEKLKEDGTIQAMRDKWIDGPLDKRSMDEFAFTGENGTLVMGTDSTTAPFAYLDGDGRMIGYDIEILSMIAQSLKMELVIRDMEFGALISALKAGSVDIIGSCITVTEERAEQVRFTAPNYENGGVCMVVLAEDDGGEAMPWYLWVADSFQRNFIQENRYNLLLNGFANTLILSVLSVVFGTLLGMLICAMHMSRFRLLKLFVRLYLRVIQGTPLVVLLMLAAYVFFPQMQWPILIASMTMGLNLAAHTSEILRTGIEAIDRGQSEAAAALGFSPWRSFVKIVFPQAVRHAIPVYKGEVITLVKMTSIVGYVAIMDITKATDIVRSRTFEPIIPLIVLAIIYIIYTSIISWLLDLLVKNVDPKRRRREVRL